MSPFEIVHDYMPHILIVLCSPPLRSRISLSIKSFVKYIHNLHNDIHCHINISNKSYKCLVDTHKYFKEFRESNFVMACIHPRQFTTWTTSNLHACRVGPFKIFKCVGPNLYVLDLLTYLGISPTFNITNLVTYHGSSEVTSEMFEPHPSPTYSSVLFPMPHDHEQDMLDE